MTRRADSTSGSSGTGSSLGRPAAGRRATRFAKRSGGRTARAAPRGARDPAATACWAGESVDPGDLAVLARGRVTVPEVARVRPTGEGRRASAAEKPSPPEPV